MRPVLALVVIAACARSHAAEPSPPPSPPMERAVFAGGCFWGIEAVFDHVKGVKTARSGYAGGKADGADYETVSTGDTGHAESVEVIFDPSQVSYGQLLQVFFTVHDPTQKDRQGPDRGTQYRSAVFFTTPAQETAAKAYLQQLTNARTYQAPVVTELAPLAAFFPAEAYHQDYLEAHRSQPYIVANDLPKLEQLQKSFPALWR
jgi:peptide-methionine (S)-S-oxide reductase